MYKPANAVDTLNTGKIRSRCKSAYFIYLRYSRRQVFFVSEMIFISFGSHNYSLHENMKSNN